ncbi:MAG TPA: endopeptidase, partial [Verrucomicrobiae bacterium]|nr:endopeptidase [Verrucomicrobiae bacterium]
QTILRALDRVPGVNSRFIELFTRDVYAYLTRTKIRERIDAIVAAGIGRQPCAVLAHSLGTIVAYNVLRSRTGDANCPRLVTVGSPLGIKAIKGKLDQPLTHPPCVQHWFNALDSRDVVALYPLDPANFDVHPPIENKTDIQNGTENRHGITGYLADAVVAEKVVEFL